MTHSILYAPVALKLKAWKDFYKNSILDVWKDSKFTSGIKKPV